MGRKGLDTVMAALAGLTLLTSNAAAIAPVRVGAEPRSAASDSAPSTPIIRDRLAIDPRLPRLLERLRKRVGQGDPEREDALAAVLLRIWERRPELLERDENELRRYLDAAVRNEACDRARARRGSQLDEEAHPPSIEPDDLEGIDAADLQAAIASRVPPLDRRILDHLVLDGASERMIAEREEISRHRVREGLGRIRETALEVLDIAH